MKIKTSLLLALAMAAISLSCYVNGQGILPQTPREDPLPAEEDSVVLRRFPAARISEAFSASSNLIAQSAKKQLTEEDIAELTQAVDTLLYEIDDFLGEYETDGLEDLVIRDLDQVIGRANVLTDKIDHVQGSLSEWALEVESESELLMQNKERWRLTQERQLSEAAPESRIQRIEQTMRKLDSVRALILEDLTLIVDGEDALTGRKLKLVELAEAARQKKADLGKTLLSIDSPGFFEDLSKLGDPGVMEMHVEKFKLSFRSDYSILKADYLQAMVLAAVFLILLMVLFFWLKANFSRVISQEEFELSGIHSIIIHSPVVTALFVVTLLMRFLLSDLPLSFLYLNVMLLLIPLAILSVRIFGKTIRTWIMALMGIYVVMFFYELTYQPGPLLRIALLAIGLAGLWLFIWLYRKKSIVTELKTDTLSRLFRGLILAFAGLEVISIFANLVGAFRLAEFLCLLPLQITVLALGIQVASKLADYFIYLLLSARILQRINVIREEARVIHKKTLWLVNLILLLYFLTRMIDFFLLKDAIFTWGREVLTEGKKIGNLDFTLANILIFFFVIWLSIVITRIVIHILEKDVYTRVSTAQGIPSTISLLLRIVLITGGFFVAAGAAGMELTNLSIVLGAFSVGIGFGLQNIFNNMVSGLILAFERPIKVDDVVQVGDLVGKVLSIGLRSSVVRSFDGAEVIVPNGNLISDQMINWTKSDSNRRMDIRVGVAYGTDPEVVIQLMQETAAEFTEVWKDPPPRAYFLEFGDSSLNFRLLAWSALDIRLEMESALMVTINRKLKEAGIEIPFPQRDLHIRSDATRPKPAPDPNSAPDPKPVSDPKPGPDPKAESKSRPGREGGNVE